MLQAADECCFPGDLTVTPIPSGYLLGKALPQQGPGPWWAFIAIIADLQEAISQARAVARDLNVRVWFFEGGDTYRRVPLDNSFFPKDTAK